MVSLVVRARNLEQYVLSTPGPAADKTYVGLLNDFVSIADRLLCPGAWKFACGNAMLGFITGVLPNQPSANALTMLLFFIELRQQTSKVRPRIGV